MLFIVHSYSDFHDINILWILTFIFNDALELLVGPILLLYVKSLFEDNKTLIKRNWYHFIVLGFYLFFISIPILISMLQGGFVFDYLEFLNTNSLLMFTILMIYLIVYMILALNLFIKYRNMMPLNFSTISENDMVWVRNMLAGSGKGTNMTVKWDGAPAIICGVNPENGKFFVGTKSVFNKNPKVIILFRCLLVAHLFTLTYNSIKHIPIIMYTFH